MDKSTSLEVSSIQDLSEWSNFNTVCRFDDYLGQAGNVPFQIWQPLPSCAGSVWRSLEAIKPEKQWIVNMECWFLSRN